MRKRRNLDVVAGATALVTGVCVARPRRSRHLSPGNRKCPSRRQRHRQRLGRRITGPAALVQGCLNTSRTTLVDVSTSGGLTANGGQARFEESGGESSISRSTSTTRIPGSPAWSSIPTPRPERTQT